MLFSYIYLFFNLPFFPLYVHFKKIILQHITIAISNSLPGNSIISVISGCVAIDWYSFSFWITFPFYFCLVSFDWMLDIINVVEFCVFFSFFKEYCSWYWQAVNLFVNLLDYFKIFFWSFVGSQWNRLHFRADFSLLLDIRFLRHWVVNEVRPFWLLGSQTSNCLQAL